MAFATHATDVRALEAADRYAAREESHDYNTLLSREMPSDFASDRSGGEDVLPLPRGPRKVQYLAKSVGVFAMVGLTVAGVLYSLSISAGGASRVPLADFVNYESAAVAPWIREKPKVCNIGVVYDICVRIQSKTASVYPDHTGHSEHSEVHAELLSQHFMVSRASVLDFLNKIKAVNTQSASDAGTGHFSVDCMDLCEKTVASFPPKMVPEMVDVGCFYKQPTDLDPSCSVDLSLSGLDADLKVDHDPDFADEALHEHSIVPLSGYQSEKIALLAAEKPADENEEFELYTQLHPDVTFGQMQMYMARLFRVYPPSKALSTQQDLEVPRRLAFPKQFEIIKKDDSCQYSKNGVCDEPASCSAGSDCSDCGTCAAVVYDNSCMYANDGKCDEIKWCTRGSDCTDCDTCPDGPEKRPHAPDDSCQLANNAHCDPDCKPFTDCSDCNNCEQTGMHTQAAQWPPMVLQLGVKAAALTSVALTAMASDAGEPVLMQWIGTVDPSIKAQLRFELSGMQRFFDDVTFKFPGPKCTAESYAYVETEKSLDAVSEFTVYLCKLFMNANPKVQLATLLHQGSRQGNTLAEQVKVDGEAVYGEGMVQDLADKCRSGSAASCKQSVRNSESIMYTIEELARLEI